MERQYTSTGISARIWFFTNLTFGFAITLLFLFQYKEGWWFIGFFASIVSSILSGPVFLLQSITLSLFRRLNSQYRLIGIITYCVVLVIPYGLCGGALNLFNELSNRYEPSFIEEFLTCTSILFACTLVAIAIDIKAIKAYLDITSI